jgi:excisionase family DNA binding protein
MNSQITVSTIKPTKGNYRDTERMKLLTTQEAAERLGVTSVRVRAMILAGRLPAEKFGHVHMIREEDLALVADRKPGRPKTHFGIFGPDYDKVVSSRGWNALTKDEQDARLLAEIERRNAELNDPRALPGTREENLRYARRIINAFEKEEAAEMVAGLPFEPPATRTRAKAKVRAKKSAAKKAKKGAAK